MKIILLEDVKSLGKKGEIVNVSDGYARNAILPKKLGVEATSKNLNVLKLQNQHADKVAAENLENAKELAKVVEQQKVVIKIKSGEGGRIFGSVSTKEIAQETKAQTGLPDLRRHPTSSTAAAHPNTDSGERTTNKEAKKGRPSDVPPA